MGEKPEGRLGAIARLLTEIDDRLKKIPEAPSRYDRFVQAQLWRERNALLEELDKLKRAPVK